jgi:hypothetical protein
MFFDLRMRQTRSTGFSLLALVVWVAPGVAQVTEVTVGVTPTCPYGISACWAGAYEALARLDGVGSVARTPDAYNCTAHVYLKHRDLPDVEQWSKQFKASVGTVYGFRGVEATIKGSVEKRDSSLLLQGPGLKEPILLAPLQNKLQWNYKKGSPRQPEPDERRAYRRLMAKTDKNKARDVEVTGPLRQTDSGFILELREWSVIAQVSTPRQKK